MGRHFYLPYSYWGLKQNVGADFVLDGNVDYGVTVYMYNLLNAN